MAANSAVEELIKGQKLMTQLKAALLGNTVLIRDNDGSDAYFKALLDEVSGSLARALMLLQSMGPNAFDVSVNDQENPSKRKSAQGARRGGYTRRAQAPGRKNFQKTTEDGYTWRKYGQKEIFSAKFPRSYFRCTHKYGKGCQATRQVQRWEEDPSMYEITYLGEHTCNQLQPNSSEQSSSYVINSELKPALEVNQHVPPSDSPSGSIKTECDENVVNTSSDCFLYSEFLQTPNVLPFDGTMSPVENYDVFSELQSLDHVSIAAGAYCELLEFDHVLGYEIFGSI